MTADQPIEPEPIAPGGRSRPLRTYLTLLVILLLLAGCVLVIHAIVAKYLGSPANSAVADCTHLGTDHFVRIQGGKVEPARTTGKLCDTLTIANQDDKLRLMAFGVHDHHTPYDGITEQVLALNQGMTITLNKAGTFTFHDHLDDAVQGSFTVQ